MASESCCPGYYIEILPKLTEQRLTRISHEETELKVQRDRDGFSAQGRRAEREELHIERMSKICWSPPQLLSWVMIRIYFPGNFLRSEKDSEEGLRAHKLPGIVPVSTSQIENLIIYWYMAWDKETRCFLSRVGTCYP